MSGNRFLDVDPSTGDLVARTAIEQSVGTSDANKIARTGPDGKFHSSLMPSGGAGGSASEVITASEDLAAGDYVNVYVVSNQRRARKALATDATKPAHGFVTGAVASNDPATVFLGGVNSAASGTFGAASMGKGVFLSSVTAGQVSLTPPTATGNIVQRLGFVIESNGTAHRLAFERNPLIRI